MSGSQTGPIRIRRVAVGATVLGCLGATALTFVLGGAAEASRLAPCGRGCSSSSSSIPGSSIPGSSVPGSSVPPSTEAPTTSEAVTTTAAPTTTVVTPSAPPSTASTTTIVIAAPEGESSVLGESVAVGGGASVGRATPAAAVRAAVAYAG